MRRTRAGAVEVLLVRRGKPPRQGQWSIPGGRQEWGERVREAASREVYEETGIAIEILGLIDVVDGLMPGPGPDGGLSHHYTLVDFAALAVGGTVRAGSDAAEARWVAAADVDGLLEWDETKRIVRAALTML